MFPELMIESLDKKHTLNEYIERITTGLNPRQNFKLGTGNNFYITVKNIDDGELLFNSCDKIDDRALAIINKRSKIEKNTILFTGIGSIGRTCFINGKPENWDISESVFAFKPNKKIPAEFLYMILISTPFQSYCLNNASGSAQKGIRMECLKKYPMPRIDEKKIKTFTKNIEPLIKMSFEYGERNKRLKKIKHVLLERYF